MRPKLPALWLWAARDLLRQPGESMFAGAALAALGVVISATLLFSQGLQVTSRRVLENAPAVVVRRVDAGGWAPMPETLVPRVRAVKGVTAARARHWGLARADAHTVTVIGLNAAVSDELGTRSTSPLRVVPGKAIVGSALGLTPGMVIELEAARSLAFEVQAVLPPAADIVAYDAVFLSVADAQSLLGLAPGMASDIAVWVFHDAEAAALGPDLSRAFPFPVRITRKEDSYAAQATEYARDSAIRLILLVPAFLALALLTLAATRQQLGSRRDIGLLKALGWDTRTLIRLQLYRALIVALPAVTISGAIAYISVFLWRAPWINAVLLGWTSSAPRLMLDPSGAVITLLEVAALLVAPWLIAAILPALKTAVVDPEEWLHGEEP